MNELKTELGRLDAQVYPGMFSNEVQATINVNGKEVTVITSREHVELDANLQPTDAGTKGKLKVYLVEATENGYLVDLPGEALGTSKRIIVDRSAIKRA